MSDQFLIWSFEHDAWWGPNHVGYTPKIEEAGVYDYDDALAICDSANVTCIHEMMVPRPESFAHCPDSGFDRRHRR